MLNGCHQIFLIVLGLSTRIPFLLGCKVHYYTRINSCRPLLSPYELDLSAFEWKKIHCLINCTFIWTAIFVTLWQKKHENSSILVWCIGFFFKTWILHCSGFWRGFENLNFWRRSDEWEVDYTSFQPSIWMPSRYRNFSKKHPNYPPCLTYVF